VAHDRLKLTIERLLSSVGLVVHPVTTYSRDGLCSVHNAGFLVDPAFKAAYQRGIEAAGDYRWEWRVHVGLWAAHTASHLPGDFVECGVSKGFLASAIMQFLDWNRLDRTFWLLDTFSGIDERYITEQERRAGILARNEGHFYAAGVEGVRRNFSEWARAKIVVGAVPETLAEVVTDQIAYLHLDMNCAPPEVAAFHHFWPKLTPGAVILLDDYANRGFESQYAAMNEAAAVYGLRVLSMPTGQGLLVKPATATPQARFSAG
jgi:hypothetical protein